MSTEVKIIDAYMSDGLSLEAKKIPCRFQSYKGGETLQIEVDNKTVTIPFDRLERLIDKARRNKDSV